MNKDVDTVTTTINVHPINFKNQKFLLPPTVAVVSETYLGEAVTIYNEDNSKYYEVNGHLYGVPELHQGDKVFVTFTKQGTTITDRYRKQNERPTIAFTQNDDGSLNINSDKSITFTTLKAKINICIDGSIIISGTKIDSLSSGTNQMKGKKIDLNC